MQIGIRAIALVLVFVVPGCATAPEQRDIENSRVIQKNYDDVWSSIMQWMTTVQWQIRTIEKDSGIIYAERANRVPATFSDCGEAPMAKELSSTGTMNIFVRSVTPDETQVTVNTSFQVVREVMAQQVTIDCFSTGELEGMVLGAASS